MTSDLWKDTNKQMCPVQGLQKKISNMREDGRKSQENEWESISHVDEEVGNTEEQVNRDSEKKNKQMEILETKKKSSRNKI